MSLLRRRMMGVKQSAPAPVDDTLIIFGSVDPSYPPVQGNYGFSCTMNGVTNEYYQNGAQYYVHDSGDGWNYEILCNGATAGRTPTDFTRTALTSGIMSEVNSLIDSKDSTAQTLALSNSVVANTPIYVVKSTTINGVEKYALAHKTQVGVVDETYVPYNGATYGLTMTIGGTSFQYYSEYPFYVYYNGNGYKLLGGTDVRRYPSQTFTTLNRQEMLYVNPDIIMTETQTRAQSVVDSIVSNHPVYVVKLATTAKYFYESTP